MQEMFLIEKAPHQHREERNDQENTSPRTERERYAGE